jgi:hypothetical protein
VRNKRTRVAWECWPRALGCLSTPRAGGNVGPLLSESDTVSSFQWWYGLYPYCQIQCSHADEGGLTVVEFRRGGFLGLLDVKSRLLLNIPYNWGRFDYARQLWEGDFEIWEGCGMHLDFLSEVRQTFECLVEMKPRENLSLFLNNPLLYFWFSTYTLGISLFYDCHSRGPSPDQRLCIFLWKSGYLIIPWPSSGRSTSVQVSHLYVMCYSWFFDSAILR